jgi:nucleotide-binding universal stress UspA family protein
MYKRILVPVDGSSCSREGLSEALQLGAALGSRIKLVHVVNELISEPVLSSEYHQRLIESLRQAGRDVLEQAQKLAKEQGAEVEVELVETIGGRAADAIVAAAERWKADLIVMGTHGRRGVSRLALGSDAELVVRSSPVAVLLVRASAES